MSVWVDNILTCTTVCQALSSTHVTLCIVLVVGAEGNVCLLWKERTAIHKILPCYSQATCTSRARGENTENDKMVKFISRRGLPNDYWKITLLLSISWSD